MENMQPSANSTQLVQVHQFDIPDTFTASLITAITDKLKPRNYPGPDGIRTEIFKLIPHLFADAAINLWRAIGRAAVYRP